MYQSSPIFRGMDVPPHWHSSVAQGHFHTIHPSNLGLPRTRPPLTSAINTILYIRYSSILYTCPNHLNTHWSTLLANSLSIPALIYTSASIRDLRANAGNQIVLMIIASILQQLQELSLPSSFRNQKRHMLSVADLHKQLLCMLIRAQAPSLPKATVLTVRSLKHCHSQVTSDVWFIEADSTLMLFTNFGHNNYHYRRA